jgi:hypothetical protein
VRAQANLGAVNAAAVGAGKDLRWDGLQACNAPSAVKLGHVSVCLPKAWEQVIAKAAAELHLHDWMVGAAQVLNKP